MTHKKILQNLAYYLLILLFIPFVILFAIGCLLYTPVDYLLFKKSLHQRDFPRRYSICLGRHSDNEAYTVIKESGLPIDYVIHPDNYDLSGYFIYKDTLLVFGEPLFFDEEKGLWLGESEIRDGCEEDEENCCKDSLTVDGIKEELLNGLAELMPDRVCNKVIFFMQRNRTESNYGKKATDILKADDGFVLYEKGCLSNAILDFIGKGDKNEAN